MTAPNRWRRNIGWAAVLGFIFAAGVVPGAVVPGAVAADPPAPQSRLESPMADLALIEPPAGSTDESCPSRRSCRA